MATEFVSTHWDNSKKFNINWRAFGLISLVMTGLALCFLWIMAQWNEQRFETNRQSVHLQYQAQLERMIETSSESMIQLSSAVSFNTGLMESILNGDRNAYEAELDALDWNLQTDSGMTLVGLFSLDWDNLFPYGEQGHEVFAARAVEHEQPYWQIECSAACRVVTYTALLHRGEVAGVLVLAEPLSNVMLRFQRVANIDTGLLADASHQDETLIPLWQRSLVALTNPEESKRVINQASKDYSLEDLKQGIALTSINDALYELKAMPIQDHQVVVISEVSEDYTALELSKQKTLQMSAGALVLGELLLLVFLWRPLSKIKMSEQLEGFVAKQTELLKERTIALSKAQSLSQNLCDSVSAAVLILGEQGEIKRANQYFVKLLGQSSKQIQDRPISDFIRSQNAHTGKRIADVYSGALDEYEHVGRIMSVSNQVHRMIWRYVPSYCCGEDIEEEFDRTIVAIGMPLMLPTLESEQEWLKKRDVETGMLNRQGAYELINSVALNSVEQNTHVLSLLRFDNKVFDTTQTEQAFGRFLSVLNASDPLQSHVSDIQFARLDKNEIAAICRAGQALDPSYLCNLLEDTLRHLAKEQRIELGTIRSASIRLEDTDHLAHIAIQRAQKFL